MDDADFTAKKVPVIPQEFLDVCCVCVAEAQPRGAATLTRHVCLQASDWHNAIGIARAMLLNCYGASKLGKISRRSLMSAMSPAQNYATFTAESMGSIVSRLKGERLL